MIEGELAALSFSLNGMMRREWRRRRRCRGGWVGIELFLVALLLRQGDEYGGLRELGEVGKRGLANVRRLDRLDGRVEAHDDLARGVLAVRDGARLLEALNVGRGLEDGGLVDELGRIDDRHAALGSHAPRLLLALTVELHGGEGEGEEGRVGERGMEM